MNLRIPGPIPVPKYILEKMARPMINHRGGEFKEILYRSTEGLKRVFGTNGDVFILTCSGTGAMEASIVNTLSPGDEVLAVSIGSFGDRFGKIAEAFGAKVTMLKFPWGEPADPDRIKTVLNDNPQITAVLVTHNETSTGVTNDLKTISGIVKKDFNKLLLVDGISSVCSLPLETDAWGCDVVATASQKGWMLPPGLAFISFSKRAWEAHKLSSMPRFYFDVEQYQKYLDMGQPPYTPAVSVMFALDRAIKSILEEGMTSIIERHADIGKFTRQGIRKLGLTVLPDERVASNTVTAAISPVGIDADELRAVIEQDHGIVLGNGQEHLQGKVFRIGHMGLTDKSEIEDVLNALADVLHKLGYPTAQA